MFWKENVIKSDVTRGANAMLPASIFPATFFALKIVVKVPYGAKIKLILFERTFRTTRNINLQFHLVLEIFRLM